MTRINLWPLRPLLALQELAPKLAERMIAGLGVADFFASISELTGRIAPPRQASPRASSATSNGASRPTARPREPSGV